MLNDEQLKAMSRSHAELESHHYQALRYHEYAYEGLMDCLREEIMLNQPVPQETEEPAPVKPISISQRQLFDRVQQLEARTLYLQNKINLTDAKKTGKKYKYE